MFSITSKFRRPVLTVWKGITLRLLSPGTLTIVQPVTPYLTMTTRYHTVTGTYCHWMIVINLLSMTTNNANAYPIVIKMDTCHRIRQSFGLIIIRLSQGRVSMEMCQYNIALAFPGANVKSSALPICLPMCGHQWHSYIAPRTVMVWLMQCRHAGTWTVQYACRIDVAILLAVPSSISHISQIE